ncbi:MAG TPA: hypothetical protein VEP89_02300 [Draconibacterium sp.]|nr:hypothetical protein [Draconibacterium sp.]
MVSIGIAIVILALFLLDYVMPALMGIGVFSFWYLFFLVADYQYIEFSDDEDKITLNYYKAISFGGKSYNSIEFPKRSLRKANFENSFFGKLTDLTIIISTKRGIAEYPVVSLTSLKLRDRQLIQKSLNSIIKR